MFEAQRVHMEAELEQMNRTGYAEIQMLKYYEQAIKDGSEDRLKGTDSPTTCRTESEKHMKTRIANHSILRII